MSTFQSPQQIAAALARARALFEARPQAGAHDDAGARVRWQGGLRMTASHANGTTMETDMPAELGGGGDRVSPGWLFRAGLAACAATTIAMTAAARGLRLELLEVAADSRSDSRGLLGMAGPDGAPVYPGPDQLRLTVRIAAAGVPAATLEALVRECQGLAPISAAARDAHDIALAVEVVAPAAAGATARVVGG